MLNAETVGAAIRQVREKKGISQEVVSSFAGIGRTHLSAIERGQRKPTLETFFRLRFLSRLKPFSLSAPFRLQIYPLDEMLFFHRVVNITYRNPDLAFLSGYHRHMLLLRGLRRIRF